MICTATINGVHVEINGSAEECANFMKSVWLERQFPERIKARVCDPYARHTGNCGARECPVIAPGETLKAYERRMVPR